MLLFSKLAPYYHLLEARDRSTADLRALDVLLCEHKPGRGRLIDLGCGTGEQSAGLQRLGWQVTGLDGSPEMISVAEERHPDLELLEGDFRSLRLHRKEYQAAISLFGSINYLHEEGEIVHLLEETRRALVEDGVFIAELWHREPYRGLYEFESPQIEVTTPDGRLIKRRRRVERTDSESRSMIRIHYEYDLFGETLAETHDFRVFSRKEVETWTKGAGWQIHSIRSGWKNRGFDLKSGTMIVVLKR